MQVVRRLAAIDAPESRQPYDSRAKQTLSDLGVQSQEVMVGGTNVTAELVRRGAAWVYRECSRDRSLLILEKQPKA